MSNTSTKAKKRTLASRRADRSSPSKPSAPSDPYALHDAPFCLLAQSYVDLVCCFPLTESVLPIQDQLSEPPTTQHHR